MESQSGSPVREQVLRRYSIYDESVKGMKATVSKVLSEYGKPPIPTALVPSMWSQRDLQKQFGEVTYPYFAISPGPIRKTYGEGYNPILAMQGSKNIRISDTEVMRLMLMPVATDFSLQFVSQGIDECQKVMESYLFRYKSMRFILNNGHISIPIKLILSNTVTTPQQGAEESGNVFRLDADLTMDTYIGECEKVRRITGISLNGDIVSNGETVAQESINIEGDDK